MMLDAIESDRPKLQHGLATGVARLAVEVFFASVIFEARCLFDHEILRCLDFLGVCYSTYVV